MNLFAFEFKKVFFSKKFAYLLLFLVVGIALLFVRNIAFQSVVEEDVKKEIIAQTRAVQATGRSYNLQLEQNPDNEEVRTLQVMNAEIRDQLYELSRVPFEDWKERLQFQNEIYEDLIIFKEAGGENPLSIKEIKESIALNEQLLTMNLQPEHTTYSVATPNFMLQIMNLLFNFGAIILLLLIIGETVSGEFEQHSINLLFSQPLKKTNVLFSKFLSAIVLYVIMITVVLLSSFFISFVLGSKGSFDYPLLMERNGTIAFMSITSYLLKGIALTSVTILFIIPMNMLYSLLFKHTLATLAATIGTLGVGYAVSSFISWGKFAWLNPFLDLIPHELILLENEVMWYTAIPISIMLAIVLYTIAHRKIKTSYIH